MAFMMTKNKPRTAGTNDPDLQELLAQRETWRAELRDLDSAPEVEELKAREQELSAGIAASGGSAHQFADLEEVRAELRRHRTWSTTIRNDRTKRLRDLQGPIERAARRNYMDATADEYQRLTEAVTVAWEAAEALKRIQDEHAAAAEAQIQDAPLGGIHRRLRLAAAIAQKPHDSAPEDLGNLVAPQPAGAR